MMPRDRGLRTTSDHTPTAYDRLAEEIAAKDAELAALRAELAAATARAEAAEEKLARKKDMLTDFIARVQAAEGHAGLTLELMAWLVKYTESNSSEVEDLEVE